MGRPPCARHPLRAGRAKNPAAAAGLLGAILLPAAWTSCSPPAPMAWAPAGHAAPDARAGDRRAVGDPFESVTQALLTPLAFTKGTDFKAAKRPDPSTIMHIDGW
ncbi:MAG: hypothetical protein R2755_04215 [Acidimicrobiales bacterium]